jgi:hypothetical protein
MDDAINSFPTTPCYVANPIADKQFALAGSQQVDMSNMFGSLVGQTNFTKTIELNSNPSVVGASINGNILTIIASTYNVGSATIQIRGTDQLGNYAIDEFTVLVYNPAGSTVEDFNDNTFTAPAYTWTLTNNGGGARNWLLSTTGAYEGISAKTDAAQRDLKVCAMETTVNFSAPGMVSFYKKTSTEANYDFLTFYIDGVSVAQWSGTVAWSKSSFQVATAGNHTFKFEYSKDESAAGGTNEVWVDYIEFITNSQPVTPPTPVLASPSNGSSSSNSTPTFDWNDVTGTTLYDLLVDNNADFSSPEINVTAVPSSYTVPTKALSSGTYYWKVKVTSASGSYSDTWSYTVSGGTITPAVPANLTTSIVSGNVYVNWDDSADATSYDVYSSADPYGTFTLLTNVTNSEYTYTPGTNTKMFFYIVAKNSTKQSPPSIIVK